MSSSYRHMESSNERIDIPIKRLSDGIQSRDTTAQWIRDSSHGGEKYRMKINIEGFDRNEVNVRVDGNRLFIYGERIENKSQVKEGIRFSFFEEFVFAFRVHRKRSSKNPMIYLLM